MSDVETTDLNPDLDAAALAALRRLVDEGPGAAGLDAEAVDTLANLGFIEKREGGLLVTGKGRLRARSDTPAG
mgnify:CR=1 FL=1